LKKNKKQPESSELSVLHLANEDERQKDVEQELVCVEQVRSAKTGLWRRRIIERICDNEVIANYKRDTHRSKSEADAKSARR